MSRSLLAFLPLAAFLGACDPATGGPAAEEFSWSGDPATSSDFGALTYTGGTTFKVWAPNATAVAVTGSFNGWSETANPLTAKAGGVWAADIDGVYGGDEYMFVIWNGSTKLTKADPRAKQMTNSAGHSVVVDPADFAWTASSYSTPSFNDQVIYEMHIGTFNDTAGGNPGTWATATAKLDYLKSLGISMIEVMPINEFPGDYSWGYNPSYPYAPESAYGTPEDMKTFVDEAHKRGIGVILDVVHNHYGPDDLSMWNFDGTDYGAGGVYFYTDWRRETPWGSRPDYGRSEVRDFIVDNARYWLGECWFDGLRWDSTVNMRSSNGTDIADGWWVMQQANEMVDSTQPWKIMIAEDLSDNEWLTKSTGAGGAGFDSQWDATFFHNVDAAIIASNDSSRDMNSVKTAIAHTYNGVATQRVVYTESHDEVANGKQRIPEMIYPGKAGSWYSRKRSTLGAAIAMTSPGIPMIFQGQEILEDGYFQDTDPVDWTKATTYSGILKEYTDLIKLRRNKNGTTAGLKGNNVNVFHVNNSDKVIAYHRWDQGGAGDDVVVIANFGSTSYSSYTFGLPRSGTWKVRFNSDSTSYSSDYGNYGSTQTTARSGSKDGLSYYGSVKLAPYSVEILSQ